MTRKRTRESLTRSLCETCFYCDGRGYIKSKSTMCYEILRAVKKEASFTDENTIIVNVHPNIADILYDEEKNRAVAVHTAYIMHALRKLYDANFLADEIEGLKK